MTFPIEPILDRIIVEKDEAKMDGSVLLPESVKGLSNIATVVAAGPGRVNLETGEFIPLSIKAGDRVWLKEYDGYIFELEGKKYFVFSENEIIGKWKGD